MAFVFEVERPPLFPINKDTSEIGPGQYLPLTSYKFDKPNPIPFGIAEKRKFPFRQNKVPGPGSYNPKEEQNISNPKLLKEQKENKEKNNKKDDKLIKKNKIKIIHKKNLESEKFQNKENLGFFTKVQRFKLKIQKGTPGPGSYDDKNILLAKSIEEQCNNKKELVFKINTNRHDIYYVNRNNNQFPWNAEVIVPKKESKKQKKNKNNIKVIQNKKENIIINDTTIINSSNKDKIGKSKSPTKKGEKKIEDENNMNFIDTDFKNKMKGNKNISNKNSIKNMKKSKTSYNFYLPDTGVKIYYSKLSKKQIKEKLEEEMAKRKIQNDIKYRVSSIPSKFSTGYEVEKESGKIVRKPIKTYFKIFSGEKNDAVGPGSYEVNLPEIWRKTGTCWSKYLCEKETLKKRPKSGNDLNENKLINHNKIDKCYIKIAKKTINKEKNENKNSTLNIHNFLRAYTTQQIMFRDPTSHKIGTLSEEIKKEDMPIFIHINDVPGPGYYYDEEKKVNNGRKNKNSFSNIKKINRFEENFIKINLDDKGGLGPGTYFNDILNLYNNQNQNNSNKKLLSNKKTKSAPFLCKSKRFVYDKPLNLPENDKKIKKEEKINNNDLTKVIQNKSIESSQTSNSTHKLGLSKKEESQNDLFNETKTKKEKKNINIKPKSLAGTFYRKDIRFRENFQEENMKKDIPGPGSYINPYTSTGKSNSVKIDDRYVDLRSYRLIIEKNKLNKYYKNRKIGKNKIFWLGETDEIKPCVGTYNPDKTMTISYDINKNKKYGNNSFNSTLYSNRNGIYLFQKNLPIGPGCYFKDKLIEEKQNNAAFNSTADRFYRGGKNNTKDFHKVPKRSLSVLVKRDYIKNEYGNTSNELSVGLKEKLIKEEKDIDLGMFNNTNTPYIVGPGTYNFLPEVYPWIKQTYNVKFI